MMRIGASHHRLVSFRNRNNSLKTLNRVIAAIISLCGAIQQQQILTCGNGSVMVGYIIKCVTPAKAGVQVLCWIPACLREAAPA